MSDKIITVKGKKYTAEEAQDLFNESPHARAERRYFKATDIHMEVRADDGDGGDSAPVISGYAAVFGEQVEFPQWRFREQIAEGAFSKSIKNDDVRALWNHDSNLPLGRNTAGTLELEEDSHGLLTRTFLPDTQAGRDARVSIERGDVTQMSFGFVVTKEEWEADDDWDNRTILEAELFDISPVTYPAYPTTSVEVERGSVERALESRAAWKEADKAWDDKLTSKRDEGDAKSERKDDMAKMKGEFKINVKLTDEARETLDRIDKAVESATTIQDCLDESSEAFSEMKAQQDELEDSITWAGSVE